MKGDVLNEDGTPKDPDGLAYMDPDERRKLINRAQRESDMALHDAPPAQRNGAAVPGENESYEQNESHEIGGAKLYPAAFYDLLPSTLKAVTETFTEDRERAVFMAGALPVIGGACPSVLLRYGGQWLAPNVYVIPVAPAGSGKGTMRHARRMGEPMNQRLIEESKQARKEWRERRKDEEAGPEPPFRTFFVAGDNSAAGLKEDLEGNAHGVVFETEIKSVTTALDQEWGDYRDVLLKGTHNEPLTKKRKGDEPIHIPRPAPSVALSGTPHSFEEIIQDAENGLFSRCNFLYFEGDDDFKNVFKDDSDDRLDAALEEAGELLNDLREQLERREEPLYVKIGDDEQRMIVEAGKKATAKVKVSSLGDFFLSSVKRAALTAFRVAALLRLLRLAEEGKRLSSVHSVEVSAEDVRAGLMFALSSLNHAAKLSERLRGEKRMGGLNATQKSFFGALPTGDFTTAKAKKMAAGFGFTDRTAANYLERFAERGLIEDTKHGTWRKPDFSSASFLSFLSFSAPEPSEEVS